MFVQVIEGRVADAEGLKRQVERWRQEIRPGAVGYLGSTGGIADDGRSILVARFESEAAARRNSDRPEQGEWWAETSKYYDGEVSFHESTDVEQITGPGSDDAGFVQVMQGRCPNRGRLQELESAMGPTLHEQRPDVLGDFRVWYGQGDFTMVIYFTSEAAARQGEAKAPPADAREGFDEWPSLLQDVRFTDLRDPWLFSA